MKRIFPFTLMATRGDGWFCSCTREAGPFVAICSCGASPITIASPFSRLEECCTSWLGSYLLSKPESPLPEPRDESFHLQHAKPTPRRGNQCHKGRCGLLRIARAG